MRKQIVEAIYSALQEISKKNGYNTDFVKISQWQDTPTEYAVNHLDLRDTEEEYSKHNNFYNSKLFIEIVAIVIEADGSAEQLGTLALADLIAAIRKMTTKGFIIDLVRSHKFIETKGRTAANIELEIVVNYKM